MSMVRTTMYGLLGMALIVLLLELLCRLLPVSTSTETGYYHDPLILSYPSHHRWTASTGWDLRNAQTLQANNLGFATEHDFVANAQAVALIGDSYVEASMLERADRPGAQLERALFGRTVYALGGPGSALLDYAERIRFMHERFGVRDFVLLMERGDVLQSLCGSGNVHGPCLDAKTLTPRTETLAPAGALKRLARRSALAQYLFSQIRVSPAKFGRQLLPAPANAAATPGAASAAPAAPLREIDAVTQAFLASALPHVSGRLVIALDANRRALYDGQTLSDPGRERFMQLARTAGVTVIDTEPLFRSHLAQSALKLDVGPTDGHLNALGVRLVAQASAQALQAPR